LQQKHPNTSLSVVLGRDARISGEMIQNLVQYTLIGLGINIIDVGLSTTPTVELMVPQYKAHGGIILTASHNPKQWNALKLLNEDGEFLNAKEGQAILNIAESSSFSFADVDALGKVALVKNAIDQHIDHVLTLSLVNVDLIRNAKLKVVVDGVNSTGGIAIPKLLDALGVETIKLFCEPNGQFPHNPEPLKEHLTDLAFMCENGEMFGEEYTLVACSDYVLSKTPGNTVSNMSSTRALNDVTKNHGGNYQASAVGEVNVVEMMKKTQAIIGGEGNGGIIYPESHYGRDALVGVALFLSLLAEQKGLVSELRASYPNYFMSKQKIELTPDIQADQALEAIAKTYKSENISTIDGVKIDFENQWVHLRKSNTEPIIRVYTEAKSQSEATELANRFRNEILSL
jgi:phosphomannomutase